jgi:hypothetical protein
MTTETRYFVMFAVVGGLFAADVLALIAILW